MPDHIMVRVGDKPSAGNAQFPFVEGEQFRAKKNHSQTLERLDERGGLSWSEAVAILEDRDWMPMHKAEASRRFHELMADRQSDGVQS